MEYTVLGKTGLRVTRLGFGGLPMQRISAEEAVTLIQSVADSGVNYIDTARSYTTSEEFIGGALKATGLRKNFILATKSMFRDKAGMAGHIDESLKMLQTDYIDLYQMHNLDLAHLDQACGEDGALTALLEARAAGKIGHIGLTTHSLEVFQKVLEMDWAETIMFPYSFVETQAADCVRRCREKNIGFIAMKPLGGGAIEDASLAIRYLMADKNVSILIPGAYCPEEVEKNAASASDTSPLSAADLESIERIRKQLGTSFCHRCNYCAPCSAGISIPNVFMFAGYFERYGLQGWASTRYMGMEKRAKDCIGCGMCEKRCPYNLPIREMMKRISAEFGE